MPFRSKKALHKVILCASRISYDTSGLRCTRAEKQASDFLTKNVMASLTLWNIVNPKKTEDFPIVKGLYGVFDFPSAWVLVRTLFEGYINMNYLLIDPRSNKEREFRLDLWDRHGLLERQRMAHSIGSHDKKLETNKKQIDELTESIRGSKYFNILSLSKQQAVLCGPGWTDVKTLSRADKANIHRSQSEFLFKFCSNYAHCESFALMQVHAVRSSNEAQKLMSLPMSFVEMFLSLTLKLFGELQQMAKPVIIGDQDLTRIIDFWHDLKTKNFKELARGSGIER